MQTNSYGRFTLPLLCALLLNSLSPLYAQAGDKIKLVSKSISLANVFNAIKKQTGLTVFYSNNLLNDKESVQVNFPNANVPQVLDYVLKGKNFTWTMQDKIIVLQKKQQTDSTVVNKVIQHITGNVTNDKNEPLPGVSVVIKNSSKGVTTDKNGNYSIDVTDNNSVLLFSYVGYANQQIAANGKAVINVKLLPESKSLNDIVVVGYGTQKKINLTGSVASINTNDIKDVPTTNISNAIAGRLPGVIATNTSGQPGSGSDLQIRGLSTLNNNSALIVVDGVVRDDGFSNLDPNEVESITILKDASASAVYGARAANGVFLITTKRGKTGKPTIVYSGMYGIQQPTSYPKLMNAYEYATIRNTALLNQGFDSTNPAQAGQFYTAEQISNFKNNIETVDWYKASFKQNSPQTQHNITINGGSDAIKYFTSLSYLNQDGMFDNINFKRFNFRTNVDAAVNKNLTVGLNLEGRQENYSEPGYDAARIFFTVIESRPVTPAFHPDGKYYNDQGEHAIAEIESSGYNRNKYGIFNGTITFEQKMPFIAQGLSLKGLASVFRNDLFGKNFLIPYTLYDEDANGNVTGTKIVGGQTTLTEQFLQERASTVNLSLNYNHQFKKHDVSGLILGERYTAKGDQLGASRSDFISTIKDELFASGTNNQTISGYGFINDSRLSLVGRANYAYNAKYLFEVSFRYDGSYRFAPGKQWGFFPAASAGWRISEEPFFKNSSINNVINNLKLRLSRGSIGNDRVDPFQFAEGYTINTGAGPVLNGSAVPGLSYGVIANPNITWETQTNNNFGLDADLFNSRLNITFDYFIRDTRDILFSRFRSVPLTFGRDLPNENYASMHSNGFEASLSYQGKAGKLTYNFNLQTSYATNKVTNIDDPANAQDFQKQLNRPLYYRSGFEALGIFQSQDEVDKWFGGQEFGTAAKPGDVKYADINADGVIDNNDQKVLSYYNTTPRIIYGFSGGLRWKGFSFNYLIQGAAQRNVLFGSTARIMYRNGGASNTFEYLADAWTPENTSAAYPEAWVGSNIINDRPSDIWLKKAGYARLKSADIGYTFNEAQLKKLGINNIRLYVSGYNLITVSQLKEFDPEVSYNSNPGGEADGHYYPQQRIYSLGINVTF